MAASFPSSIKTWVPVVDNVDEILAAHVNGAYDEIIAIETATKSILVDTATNAQDIKLLENAMVQLNPSGDAKVSITGYDAINSLPKNAAQAGLSVIQGGMTAQNLVTNGDFSNGTTGWSAWNSTLTASGNILSVTNGGADVLSRCIKDLGKKFAVGAKIYVNYSFRVTNSSAANMLIYVRDGASGSIHTSQTVTTPTQNQWYRVSLIGTITTNVNTLNLIIQQTYTDAATANGKVMEVQQVFTINLTAMFGAGNEPTVATCDKIFADYFNATQSAVTGRVKSVGKNLFDGVWVQGYYYVPTGSLVGAADFCYSPTYLSVVAGSYTMGSGGVRLANWTDMIFYDSNKQYISGFHQSENSTFTAPANARYARISGYVINNLNIITFQLELGSVATVYEPYKSTERYCLPLPLYRVPNGVRDTIEGGKHYQRMQKYTLVAGDMTGLSTYEGVDYVSVATSIFAGSVDWSGNVVTGKLIVGSLAERANVPGQYSSGNFFVATATSLLIAFPIGTYANLAAAQAALAGTVIYYQLATPIVTDNVTSGTLLGYPSGSVYQEPVIADIGVYATELTIFNTAYPITSLESLYKIDMTTGEQLELNPATAVIASGGLSFTHASLAASDLVGFTYFFAHALPYGENTYTYYDSNVVAIDTVDGKAYRYKPVVTSGAIASWAITEVV